MKKPLTFIFPLLLGLGSFATGQNTSPRERTLFNEGWRFQKNDPEGTGKNLDYDKLKPWMLPTANTLLAAGKGSTRPEGEEPGKDVSYTRTDFDDKGWRKLDLPHDWGIEGPFDQNLPGETGKLPWQGVGWYRKTFNLPASDSGRRIVLEIDGSMSFSAVWCNDRLVGGWAYGYSSYQLDLTPYVKTGGANTLAIRLDNVKDSSRWYPGSGLYRNVWLTKTSPVHVGQWSTHITTPQVSPDSATVEVKTTIANSSERDVAVRVATRILRLSADGMPQGAGLATSPPVSLNVPAGGSAPAAATLKLSNPKLWELSSPGLYLAVTLVQQDGKVVDRSETRFGVRTINFTMEDGFHLNGKRVPIQGVCMHHDLGALGSAFNTRAAERQLEILKEMGVNAIRTAHNSPAPELLDLCDRMGILVMDEFTDTWTHAKKPNGYAKLFQDWHEADLRTLVRRDRNHPSIVLWSTGNEVSEQEGKQPEGANISTMLADIVKSEDDTRSVTVGVSNTKGGYNGFEQTVGVFGYNYKPHDYRNFREKHPTIPLYGSETASATSSRGEYLFPVTGNRDGGKIGFHMSSYDLYMPSWASLPDVEFKAQDENPSVAGEFVWTGFDYLGEPTPFNGDMTNLLNYHTPEAKAAAEKELQELGKIKVPSRSSYFGIVDLAGFKKDRFYLYQARWRPELPMAHILPHWNWAEREGQITPVFVYTSGDEAELFLNGKSLGRKKKAKLEYRIRWDDVVYTPGELKVIAYKAGKEWATSTVKTTGPAAKLLLSPDRGAITPDGRDLSFVTATVADASGQLVPRSDQALKFEISGPGEIAATDNGDPTDHTAFLSPARKAFNGLALAIVRLKPGSNAPVTLRVTSEGLAPATVVITPARP